MGQHVRHETHEARASSLSQAAPLAASILPDMVLSAGNTMCRDGRAYVEWGPRGEPHCGGGGSSSAVGIS